MGDLMRPVPFEELLHRMISEFAVSSSIFSIHQDQFFTKSTDRTVQVLSQKCSVPVGPAAGPHTQLAQNIITSYLTGGRFMELKTVQKLDTLEIDKPCIDARDEGYNVEWSTEFTLEKAYDEYLKAWIILHLLEEVLTGSPVAVPSFIFNMSVGYDLDGIRTEKMQRYIDQMLDASTHPAFVSYRTYLDALIEEGEFLDGLGLDVSYESLKGISSRISAVISPSVTLSTMHGCPPEEIEAICHYMLTEKSIDTFVKLNPTLLGYDTVREILDGLSYDYLHLNRESFDHDLQYPDAVAMIRRLTATAQKQGKKFGVKLTNTLGSVNDQGQLPGQEMYMSGRALYPLSINLAARLSTEFSGALPISYSGGANAQNIQKIFNTGIHPITLATDLLKPGGYVRMKQLAQLCEDAYGWDREGIDVEALNALAQEARSAEPFSKNHRGTDVITTGAPLPQYDCYVAPCTVACPIGQDVPEYIYLAGEGRYADALSVIYEKNALPNITGHICDHQCMFNCTRLDYEGTVQIREMKRIAVDNGFEEYIASWEAPEKTDIKAAVIGAGPAGLSAAYFLARSGFDVEVFEREESAGGVVRHVIPGFRLPQEVIEADIAFIERHGVKFTFGAEPVTTSVEALKQAGFGYIFYAVGAEKDNPIPLEGSRKAVIEALDFLGSYRKDPSSTSLGAHVVVVGGGNTAMDSARAALTVPGVASVDVLYRRSKQEMPADLEEYDNAVAEGAIFRFLTNPEGFTDEGKLVCRVMELGQPDESGRRRPVSTDESFELEVDSMITAIGEHVDSQALELMGVTVNEKGWVDVDDQTLETAQEGVYIIGDAQSGPSTVVQCIASARKAVEAAIDREIGPLEEEGHVCDESCDHDHDDQEDALSEEELDDIEQAENEFFSEIRGKKGFIEEPAAAELPDEQFAQIEAKRCLECSYICNKCVEVCPNRANIAIDVRESGLFDNPYQIIHIDAFCNECGNCATFCPWEGKPYRDKLTVFSRKDDFENSENPGFFYENGTVLLRDGGSVSTHSIDADGILNGDVDEKTQELIELIIEQYAYLLGPVEA